MNWFRKTPPESPEGPQPPTEAERALARSRRERARVEAQESNVERAAEKMADALRQNNFAEKIRLAMEVR